MPGGGIARMLAVCGTLGCLAGLPAPPAVAAETAVQTGLVGSPNAITWPWYIGIDKGFFAAAGIKLDLIYAQTPASLVQQLAAGSLDIVGDVGLVEPIHAADRGAPVGIMRIMGQVPPYEFLAKPTIASIKDLKGKTICIGGLRDINRVYLERVMAANGLHDGDYDLMVVGSTGGRFAALKTGTVDATMLAPPVSLFAEDAGFHSLGLVLTYAPDLPFSASDVSLAYARTHHDTLEKLLAALDKSITWFNDPANRTEAVDILVKQMKSPRQPVERTYDFLRKLDYFAPDTDVSRSRLQNVINAMKALGDIKGTITPDRLVVPSLAHLVN
jgi:NitT/TauT family transport system substrate-binding protein